MIATNPTASTVLAPILVTSIWASPAQSTALPAVARNVSPVLRAEYPSPCCTYSVRTKKFANVTAPGRGPATCAPASVQQVLGYAALRTGLTFLATAGSAVLWAGL